MCSRIRFTSVSTFALRFASSATLYSLAAISQASRCEWSDQGVR